MPFAALAFLIVTLRGTKHSPLEDGALQVEIQGIMGQAVTFLQGLGALQTAGMRMGEPMTSPADIARVLSSPPAPAFGVSAYQQWKKGMRVKNRTVGAILRS